MTDPNVGVAHQPGGGQVGTSISQHEQAEQLRRQRAEAPIRDRATLSDLQARLGTLNARLGDSGALLRDHVNRLIGAEPQAPQSGTEQAEPFSLLDKLEKTIDITELVVSALQHEVERLDGV